MSELKFYNWTAPSGVQVYSCKPFKKMGGFWAHWWHYIKMVAALQGCRWAYDPHKTGA